MIADVGWSVLVGMVGWMVAWMISGDAVAFFLLGSMWLVGFLAVVVAVFLVWMPVALFASAVAVRRRGGKARGSWLSLAWCLVGLDLLVVLVVAEAVFVPRGADGGARPENLWQTILFVGVSGLLILLSIARVVFWVGSWDPYPKQRLSTKSSVPRTKKKSR